jgi:hypothetical protein
MMKVKIFVYIVLGISVKVNCPHVNNKLKNTVMCKFFSDHSMDDRTRNNWKNTANILT